jgi:hypothetical protein
MIMSEWVWSYRQLKILPLSAPFYNYLLEAQFLSVWHQKSTRQINFFCNRDPDRVLSLDQAIGNIFHYFTGLTRQKMQIREKPA